MSPLRRILGGGRVPRPPCGYATAIGASVFTEFRILWHVNWCLLVIFDVPSSIGQKILRAQNKYLKKHITSAEKVTFYLKINELIEELKCLCIPVKVIYISHKVIKYMHIIFRLVGNKLPLKPFTMSQIIMEIDDPCSITLNYRL